MKTERVESAHELERLRQRVQELESALQAERDRADLAENRADDLSGQVRIKDETLRWIYQSKVYRLSRMCCRGLDVVLAPLQAWRRRRAPAPAARVAPASSTVTANTTAVADASPALPDPQLPAATTYDVIRLPVIDWEFRFQRPQQLMRQLARRGHRVFYARTRLHESATAAPCQRLMRNVFGLPLVGPAHLNLYRDSLDHDAVEQVMQSLDDLRVREGIHHAVCIVDLPFWAPLALEMRNRWGWPVVYDCMDEHAGFSTNDSAMTELEDSIVAASDLVLTTAKNLTEKARRLNEQVLPLPNAGEHEHFATAHAVRSLAADDTPVIGYYGAISDWFDVQMIVEAAQARPGWRFLLIGAISDIDPRPFERMPNIELRGEIPYAELPTHVTEFDVACIPFRDTDLTRATNPVKFFEYLSAGKPVVSVDLLELQPYRDFYYSTSGPDGFVGAVERALLENSETLAQARMQFGKGHTWEARAATLSDGLDALSGRVAIIVVSYQNPDYLRQCLESIFDKTVYPDFEVIAVDNASDQEVVDYLRAFAAREPRLRLILNDDNLGFAKANNQGILAADAADYVVLLNNDTIVPPGWLCGLVRYLQNEEVGMVGPVTSFAGNEARIEVDYDSPAGIDGFARRYTAAHRELHFDIDVLAMFCVGLRKAVIDEVGLLDERYVRGMFEDDDYAKRVREAGYRTVCAEDVFVHHWGEGSFGKIHRPEYLALFEVNKRRFEEKWKRQWVPHVARPWSQDDPPADRVRPFRVDLRSGGQAPAESSRAG